MTAGRAFGFNAGHERGAGDAGNAALARMGGMLLTPEEMAAVDRRTIEGGIEGYRLMRAAGAAVADAVLRHAPGARRAVVFCGPGNNGGDGYVAARHLTASGIAVAIHHFGDPERLAGDAARARRECAVESKPLSAYRPEPGDVVVDALFGAGLSRPLPGEVADLVAAVGKADVPVVAVDVPSGISGASGQVLGAAFQATVTITFVCAKPGHLLFPGRAACGALEIHDIGVPARAVVAAGTTLHVNGPPLWRSALLRPQATGHKYGRGHLGVFSGPLAATGAARLSAEAGLKAGAGLVTIASPPGALTTNAAHLTAIMLRAVSDAASLAAWLDDRRLTAFVLGPGFGDAERARRFVQLIAEAGRALVLDADGITAFAQHAELLLSAFASRLGGYVLTPHEGEFGRLFPDLAEDGRTSKVERARTAARRSGAIVVLKGADTVVAAPDGRACINANAPEWLATAGSGDVLAGIVGGFLAQGMAPFEAAAAAVWVHGEAGRRAGGNLTAEDLPQEVPAAIAEAHSQSA